MSLLSMSLTAGMLIALTALLRLTAGDRLPRRMYMALWDIALLRLLVPFSLRWRFSPQALIGRVMTRGRVVVTTVTQANAPLTIGTAMAAQAVPPASGTGAGNPAPHIVPGTAMETVSEAAARGFALPDLTQVLAAVWVIGMLILAAYFLRSYMVSLRAFAQSLPDDDPRTAAFLRAHPLRRHVQVRVSGRIASPLSYGLLRPVILLPKGMDRGDGRALYYVLLHEMMHIRALDAGRKLLMLAALCVHWMNPMVWIMFLLVNRDMELLCDERVLAEAGRSARREYALTLLTMEERRCRLSPIASSFSMTGIEERIKMMQNMKKTGIASAILAALLVMGSGVALATSAPKEEEDSRTINYTVITNEGGKVTVNAIGDEEVTKRYSVATITDEDGKEEYVITYDGEKLAALDKEGQYVIQDMDGGKMITYTEPEVEISLTEGQSADAGNGSQETYSVSAAGDPVIDKESWEKYYKKYAPYGLGYDETAQRLTYDGKIVRTFEDMYPIDEQTVAGTVLQMPDGEVDVYAVRDLTGPIVRNLDGSFDPSGKLTGLREATKEEFDERTREIEEAKQQIRHAMGAYDVQTGAASFSVEVEENDGVTTYLAEGIAGEDGGVSVYPSVVQGSVDTDEGIEWWTAEEYENWMQEQYEALTEMAAEGAWGYTNSDGWFLWTDEKVDETMALYGRILSDIQSGVKVSKTLELADGSAIQMTVVDESGGSMVTETGEDVAQSGSSGNTVVISGAAVDNVPSVSSAADSQENHTWAETLAPYVQVGLLYMDDGEGGVRMYYEGNEVRGIWDAQRGVWISQSMGMNRFDENATEFIAVYEDGVLTGLRPANEQEKAFWDAQRGN